jgi:hypothetical protein
MHTDVTYLSTTNLHDLTRTFFMDATTAPPPTAEPLPIAPVAPMAPSAEDHNSTAAPPPAISLDEDESEYETDSDAEPEVFAFSHKFLPIHTH